MTDGPEGSAVVITGASSGIGRATALAMARRGMRMVLISRQEQALDELAGRCARLGGRAVAMAADVADEESVSEAARLAVDEFGGLDVWINNAAVTLYGELDQVPLEDFRRVLDTNLLGYVNGARAALPVFRRQNRGVLLNVGSMVGRIGQALAGAYVVSKFGVMGLSSALRQDLIDERNIHVVTVIPPSVDTPLFQHGGNYTGKAARPIQPVYPAEEVAAAILGAVERPRREIVVGGQARLGLLAHRIYPPVVERISPRIVRRRHFQDYPQAPSRGNLFEPDPQWNTVSGGWVLGRGMKSMILLVGGTLAASAILLFKICGRSGMRE